MEKIRKEGNTLKTLVLGGEQIFLPAKYEDKQGKLRDCYSIDKNGMLMLLNSEIEEMIKRYA